MAAISSNLVLEAIPKAERISSAVFRVLGLNPGSHTLQGTNTYIVGTGERRVLIDAGEHNRPDYLQLLKESLASLKAGLSHILVTHWHHDHIGGVEAVWKMVGEPYPKVYKLALPPEKAQLDGKYISSTFPLEYISNGDVIRGEGVTLRILATPGHTDDHMALFFEEEKAVFSGDCVLGQGTTVLENLSDFMESLNILKELSPAIIYPGHGPVLTNPVSVLEGYIQHRMKRENQILELLQSLTQPISSMEIVEILYKDVPQNLWNSANRNVQLHLQKLCLEGRASKVDNNKYVKNSSSF